MGYLVGGGGEVGREGGGGVRWGEVGGGGGEGGGRIDITGGTLVIQRQELRWMDIYIVYVHNVHVHVLMRDERRKEERKKQARSNKHVQVVTCGELKDLSSSALSSEVFSLTCSDFASASRCWAFTP